MCTLLDLLRRTVAVITGLEHLHPVRQAAPQAEFRRWADSGSLDDMTCHFVYPPRLSLCHTVTSSHRLNLSKFAPPQALLAGRSIRLAPNSPCR